MKYTCLFLCFILSINFGFSQESTSTISTDRPTFGATTTNMQQGAFQIETGLQYERNLYGVVMLGNVDFVGNVTTLRYGISNSVEVKLDLPSGYEWYTESDATAPGLLFNGPSVGLRITVLQDESLGKILLYGMASIQALSTANTDTELGIDVRALYNRMLGESTSLDVNAGFHTPYGLGNWMVWHGTVAVTQSVCNRWSVFGEYYYQYDTLQRPSDADGYSTHWVDAGTIFNPTPSTQIDFAAGYYLDNLLHDYVERAAPAFFISLGGAIRL